MSRIRMSRRDSMPLVHSFKYIPCSGYAGKVKKGNLLFCLLGDLKNVGWIFEFLLGHRVRWDL